MALHAQYCGTCTFPYKQMGACPKPGESMFWAYISMVPYLIPIIYCFVIVITRRLSHIKTVSLLASCYIFGDKVLKNIIKSHRPLLSCKSSFGMPSSHMAVMATFCLLQFKKNNPMYIKLLWITVTVLEGYSRMILNYHTLTQVIWGSLYGIAYSIIFEQLWLRLFQPWLMNILNKLSGDRPLIHQQ